MRIINICAALSGLLALVMLAYGAHALSDPEAVERVKLGGFTQLGVAAAGLAIASRSGRINAIGGALILLGAALFSGALYAISLSGSMSFAMAAPFGGISMMLGFLVLAFAKPS